VTPPSVHTATKEGFSYSRANGERCTEPRVGAFYTLGPSRVLAVLGAGAVAFAVGAISSNWLE
jgi:hypothetical protein